jgi:3',5'-cyclic AMP phosphodiesterase CpdA
VRTLAQLSDLHFGRADRALLEPLRRRLEALAPDVVVVCGDLTQRARPEQFREARAFLDSLPKPQVVVPGNHDLPLYNVLERFLTPLRHYRLIVSQDPEPGFVDDEIAVLGINTARAFAFKGGRVSAQQLRRVRDVLGRLDGRTRILVSHHPFMPLEKLAECGVDVLVSGHRHAAHIDYRGALMVEASTATSWRTRAEPNGFNLLRIEPRRVEIEHYWLQAGNFVRAARAAFSRQAGGWQRAGPALRQQL